jgi:ABC-type sugar transport system ATPase subunit
LEGHALSEYLLEMIDITKEFPGVKALDKVNFKLKKGRVHSLMGENGAGKSTLMKCLIGIIEPTEGKIIYRGKEEKIPSTSVGLKMGISMIHQELSPVLHRTIMENVWLGREPLKGPLRLVDHTKMYNMTKELLEELELEIDPKEKMENLTVAKMQMVEIAKAVSYNAEIVIMDEPTSALTDKEVAHLFKIIRRLRDKGTAIVYISHKMDEIFEISDDITIFRDGQYIATHEAKDIDSNKLISLMVGRELNQMFPKIECEIGEIKIKVEKLSSYKAFQNVSFDVRKGEIFGIAGLVGAGRTEIVETLFGMREASSGHIYIDGKEVFIKTSSDAIANKMALLTEDRRHTGIFPMLSVRDNTIMANTLRYVNKYKLLNHKDIERDCILYKDKIRIKTPSLDQKIQNLSGGNQQKVLVARWLLTNPDILILDEPTRGIDVGAKAEIHSIVTDLARQGKTIIMVSSELPEVLGMCDRIMVMHEGKVTGILDRKEATQEVTMKYATNTMHK